MQKKAKKLKPKPGWLTENAEMKISDSLPLGIGPRIAFETSDRKARMYVTADIFNLWIVRVSVDISEKNQPQWQWHHEVSLKTMDDLKRMFGLESMPYRFPSFSRNDKTSTLEIFVFAKGKQRRVAGIHLTNEIKELVKGLEGSPVEYPPKRPSLFSS